MHSLHALWLWITAKSCNVSQPIILNVQEEEEEAKNSASLTVLDDSSTNIQHHRTATPSL